MSCFLDIWLAMLVCASREFPLPDWQPSSACDEMAWRNGRTLNTFASSGGLFPYRERLTQLGETDGNLFNVFESPCRKKIQLEFARISHFGSLQFFSFISSKISNARYFSCCEFISTVTRLFDDASLAWVYSTWECAICSMFAHLHFAPSTTQRSPLFLLLRRLEQQLAGALRRHSGISIIHFIVNGALLKGVQSDYFNTTLKWGSSAIFKDEKRKDQIEIGPETRQIFTSVKLAL